MKNRLFAVLAPTLLTAFSFQPTAAHAQGTAFTYQGQLQNNGSPASGSYNLTFALFDTNASGVAIAGPVTNNAVSVSNGLFTTTIDFGAGVFAGATNWLQIGVATNGVSSFSTLTPRQQLTPTPYAIMANSASTLLGNIPAAKLPGFQGPYYSTIGGGYGNSTSFAVVATVGGGQDNMSGGFAATIAGGDTSTANGDHATVGGGGNNGANGSYSTVGGGGNNSANGSFSTVGGGSFNLIDAGGDHSTIGGGFANHVVGYESTIGGGYVNLINGQDDVIAGGDLNVINVGANQSFIGGGINNTNTGSLAIIPGGDHNVATNNSFAAGHRAKAVNPGAFLWADSQDADFSSTASNQFLIRAQGGVGVNMNNPNGASLYVKGDRTNGWPNSMSWFENTETGTNASPALRVLVDGSAPGGALSVSVQGGGLIAQFGNGGAFVSQLDVNGNWTANSFNGGGSGLTGLNAANLTGALPAISGANLTSLNANSLSSGTVPLAQMPAAVVTNNSKGLTLSGAFSGNGSALTNLNASQLTSIGNTNGGVNNSFVGPSGNATTSGSDNTAIGLEALYQNASGSDNTAIGTLALYGNTSGNDNTAVGSTALLFDTSGGYNTASGAYALYRNASGSYNTADGALALYALGVNGAGGSYNIALGYGAGYYLSGNESNNIYIGNQGVPGDNNLIRIGQPGTQTSAFIAGVINGNGGGLTNLNASQLISIGNANGGLNNSFVGPSGNATTSGSDNTAIGLEALYQNMSGSDNTALGLAALYGNTSGNDNTAVGSKALLFNTSGGFNTAVGDAALNSNMSGGYNTAIGDSALDYNTTGFYNTAIGSSALYGLGANFAGGTNNIALGYLAGFAFTGNESGNIDIGNQGVRGDNNIIRIGQPGTQTSAFIAGVINGNGGGLTNLNAAQVTGSFTSGFAITGSQSGGIGSPLALIQNNNNSGNTAPALRIIGYGNSPNGVLSVSSQGTGLLAQFGNANVFVADITTNGTVDAASFSGNSANVTSLNAASVSVTNQLRLNDKPVYFRAGGDVNHGLAYSGTTVTNFGTGNVQVDGPVLWGFSGGALAVMNGGAHAVLTWTNGGVSVTGGFAFSSDRNMKTGFAALDASEVLARVAALPLSSWYYNTDTGARHLGPMAQDFHAAFALGGDDDKHINVGDEGGVALAAIQGLNQKLETEVKQKDQRIGELEKRLNDLEQLVHSMASKK